MKVASEGRPERQASQGAGWGHPALTCFRSPLGSSQVKPLLPPFIPNLFFEVWLHFLILTSFFFFFFVIFARAFTMRFPFILKTVAFKSPLIYDCFMFAGFWKVWSWTLGGRLPICSLLCSWAWKGCGPRSCGLLFSPPPAGPV